MNQDIEHLKLLSVFHYVVAGLLALFACIPLIHFFMGLAITLGLLEDTDAAAGTIGILIMLVAGGFILIGWTIAVLVFFAGRNLAKRTRYTYCLVMAGVECIFMPFGTVLGVFTIVVLMRDSVKAMFLSASGGSVQPAPES